MRIRNHSPIQLRELLLVQQPHFASASGYPCLTEWILSLSVITYSVPSLSCPYIHFAVSPSGIVRFAFGSGKKYCEFSVLHNNHNKTCSGSLIWTHELSLCFRGLHEPMRPCNGLATANQQSVLSTLWPSSWNRQLALSCSMLLAFCNCEDALFTLEELWQLWL